MLKSFVIANLKEDFNIKLKRIKNFIPKIDNWAVCDSFSSTLKSTRKNKEIMWKFLQPYFKSKNEFDVRFAVVMTLWYYIDDKYLNELFKIYNSIKHEGYYVKMAIAWALSYCYIKYQKETLKYFKNNKLDNFTLNKAVQKSCESYRVSKEYKIMLRTLKRQKV